MAQLNQIYKCNLCKNMYKKYDVIFVDYEKQINM